MTGAVLIWIIKLIIRPVYLVDDPIRFFLGIAPNLIGSFLIPFGAYWFFSGKNYLIARVFRIQCDFDLRMVCVMGFCMLIVNEYLQLVPFFGRTFDVYDITFSSIGLLVSYFAFSRIRQRYTVVAN